jgi:hypothetical protein
MSFDQARRTRGVRTGALLALVALLAIACSQAASTPTATPTSSLGLGATPTPSGTASSSPTVTPPVTAVPTAQGTTSAQPVLLAHLCDMLDTATIDTVTGLQVPAGQEAAGFAGPGLSATGHCLWGKPSTGVGVEISSFDEAPMKAFLGGASSGSTCPKSCNVAGMQAIPGVGVSAQGSAVVISGVTHASLYVDFGTFGMLIVTDTPTDTIDMSVALAKALK